MREVGHRHPYKVVHYSLTCINLVMFGGGVRRQASSCREYVLVVVRGCESSRVRNAGPPVVSHDCGARGSLTFMNVCRVRSRKMGCYYCGVCVECEACF